MRHLIVLQLFLCLAFGKPQPGVIDMDEGSGEITLHHKLWQLTAKPDGSLPRCQVKKKRRRFVSEICNIVQPGEEMGEEDRDDPTFVFQYCECPNHWECSKSTRLDDPYSYAVIGNLQFKTCLAQHHLPLCGGRKYSSVAKIWYGEDLPHRVLVHCRCPPGSVWGDLSCTSSGRICYVLNCAKVF